MLQEKIPNNTGVYFRPLSEEVYVEVEAAGEKDSHEVMGHTGCNHEQIEHVSRVIKQSLHTL